MSEREPVQLGDEVVKPLEAPSEVLDVAEEARLQVCMAKFKASTDLSSASMSPHIGSNCFAYPPERRGETLVVGTKLFIGHWLKVGHGTDVMFAAGPLLKQFLVNNELNVDINSLDVKFLKPLNKEMLIKIGYEKDVLPSLNNGNTFEILLQLENGIRIKIIGEDLPSVDLAPADASNTFVDDVCVKPFAKWVVSDGEIGDRIKLESLEGSVDLEFAKMSAKNPEGKRINGGEIIPVEFCFMKGDRQVGHGVFNLVAFK